MMARSGRKDRGRVTEKLSDDEYKELILTGETVASYEEWRAANPKLAEIWEDGRVRQGRNFRMREWIRDALTAEGKTQKEFADAMRKSLGAVTKIIRGGPSDGGLTADARTVLAHLLNTTIDAISERASKYTPVLGELPYKAQPGRRLTLQQADEELSSFVKQIEGRLPRGYKIEIKLVRGLTVVKGDE